MLGSIPSVLRRVCLLAILRAQGKRIRSIMHRRVLHAGAVILKNWSAQGCIVARDLLRRQQKSMVPLLCGERSKWTYVSRPFELIWLLPPLGISRQLYSSEPLIRFATRRTSMLAETARCVKSSIKRKTTSSVGEFALLLSGLVGRNGSSFSILTWSV